MTDVRSNSEMALTYADKRPVDSAEIRHFHDLASELWSEYLRLGPGQLDATAWNRVCEAAHDVRRHWERESTPIEGSPSVAELRAALDTIVDLARKCVESSNGLCFISGEAGLIPRADLHHQMETCLEKIGSSLPPLDPPHAGK